MPISVKCPDCGKGLKVKDEAAGKRVKCPGCGKAVAVPDADLTPSDDPPVRKSSRPGPLPTPAPQRPQPPEEDDDATEAIPHARKRPARSEPEEDVDEESPPPPRKRPRPRPAADSGSGMLLRGIFALVLILGGGAAFWWFGLRHSGTSVDDASWQEFTSAEGAFKVMLPGSPKPTSQTLNTPFGPLTQQTFTVDKGNEKFLVAFVDYPPKALEPGADAIVEGELAPLLNLPKRPKMKGRKGAWQLAPGLTAAEISVDSVDKGMLRARAVMVKQRLFTMMLLTPSDDRYEQVAKKIYDSFALVGEVPDRTKPPEEEKKEGEKKETETPKKMEPPGPFAGHDGNINRLVLSPAGDGLASVADDGRLRLWDYPAGKFLREADLRDDFRNPVHVAFPPSGDLLAVALGGPGEKLILFDLGSGAIRHKISAPPGGVVDLYFGKDGKHLYWSNMQRVYEFDLAAPEKPRELCEGAGAAPTPDGKGLFTPFRKEVLLCGLPAGKCTPLPGPAFDRDPRRLVVDAHGKVLAAAVHDEVHFWDAGKLGHLDARTLKVGNNDRLALSHGGSLLAVGTDRDWRIFPETGGKAIAEGKGYVRALTFAPDGKLILADGPRLQVVGPFGAK